ncbi:DUF397 domain-containing protein [Streptomyces sp. NBC_01235]|uniref:DUF397 domain-containing protein n=1 Tax=Streptomyces sp. NBC_01235 TaxID=2903788 RepID=UPI002E0F40DE|nr:DUF397 domain-containing protein [Streptomyces sp. NBC_01235]
MPDLLFEESGYSDVSGECAEVARNNPTTVAVRDFRTPDGPTPRLTRPTGRSSPRV